MWFLHIPHGNVVVIWLQCGCNLVVIEYYQNILHIDIPITNVFWYHFLIWRCFTDTNVPLTTQCVTCQHVHT